MLATLKRLARDGYPGQFMKACYAYNLEEEDAEKIKARFAQIGRTLSAEGSKDDSPFDDFPVITYVAAQVLGPMALSQSVLAMVHARVT